MNTVLIRIVQCYPVLFLSEMSFYITSQLRQTRVATAVLGPVHSEMLSLKHPLSFQWQALGFQFTKSGGEEESRGTEGTFG